MDNKKEVSLTTDLSKKIRSLSLDKESLRRLIETLQERCFAAAEIELANFNQLNLTNEEFEKDKQILRNGFEFYITLTGKDGRKLNGSIDAIFDSPNFPEDVASVFLDSSSPLRVVHNYAPRNSLLLFLDFNKPDIFNFSLLPSQETPNESNVRVCGSDSTWVNGVFHEFVKVVDGNPSTFTWLHRHTTYDIVVWLFGLPFAFWVCYKASHQVSRILGSNSEFLMSALYVYIFFLSLVCLRIMFHYARWIWAIVEYRERKNKALKHRYIWGTLILGLITTLVCDLLKLIFNP